QFNKAVAGRAKVKAPAPRAVSNAVTEITKGLQALQAALRTGTVKRIQTRCRDLARAVTKQLGPLRQATAYWERTSVASGSVVDARAALQAADAMRLALLALSAARQAGWEAGWGDDGKGLAAWRAAAKKAFKSAFKEPKVTPLAKVVAAPGAFKGR